jgi:phosphoribosylglycinamide formyltransferase-1
VERAHQANIDCFVFNPKDYNDRSDYELEIVAELERREIDLIVLAGYMLLVTPVLVERYAGKMINIHPSLLPSFPGLNAIGQAFDYGVKLTGVTVHFVDGGMDTGAVIAQEAVVIEAEDTLVSLESKIRSIETTLYPKVVSWFADGRVTLDGRKVTIK